MIFFFLFCFMFCFLENVNCIVYHIYMEKIYSLWLISSWSRNQTNEHEQTPMNANDAVSTRSFVFVCVCLFHVEFSLHLVKYKKQCNAMAENVLNKWNTPCPRISIGRIKTAVLYSDFKLALRKTQLVYDNKIYYIRQT